ncbi:MAG: hypothetical protein OEP48_16035 [Betaproteobacteria bacterium]|nr:hypothetical protein [Betaproteobacteria bacterium]MDH3438205.1 hypothetical protein [Betaproteobacteria bacterium]
MYYDTMLLPSASPFQPSSQKMGPTPRFSRESFIAKNAEAAKENNSCTAKDAGAAKENNSLTAKGAEGAEKERSLTAKGAEGAKEQ